MLTPKAPHSGRVCVKNSDWSKCPMTDTALHLNAGRKTLKSRVKYLYWEIVNTIDYPTSDWSLPCQLDHGTEYHVQRFLEHLQRWWWCHLSGQSVSMLNSPFLEEIPPDVQSKSPLAQLELIIQPSSFRNLNIEPEFYWTWASSAHHTCHHKCLCICGIINPKPKTPPIRGKLPEPSLPVTINYSVWAQWVPVSAWSGEGQSKSWLSPCS